MPEPITYHDYEFHLVSGTRLEASVQVGRDSVTWGDEWIALETHWAEARQEVRILRAQLAAWHCFTRKEQPEPTKPEDRVL